MDGYNSLLERAKARLAAIASRDKSDSPHQSPPPRRTPLLTPTQTTHPQTFTGKTTDPPPTNDAPAQDSRPRRLSSRFLDSTPPATSRTINLRSRSTDRRTSADAIPTKPTMENGTKVSPLHTARARISSVSRRDGNDATASSRSHESPTAQAIARIKADLGLAAAGGPSVVLGEVGGSSPAASGPSNSAKIQCRNLLNFLDGVLQKVGQVYNSLKDFLVKTNSDRFGFKISITLFFILRLVGFLAIKKTVKRGFKVIFNTFYWNFFDFSQGYLTKFFIKWTLFGNFLITF